MYLYFIIILFFFIFIWNFECELYDKAAIYSIICHKYMEFCGLSKEEKLLRDMTLKGHFKISSKFADGRIFEYVNVIYIILYNTHTRAHTHISTYEWACTTQAHRSAYVYTHARTHTHSLRDSKITHAHSLVYICGVCVSMCMWVRVCGVNVCFCTHLLNTFLKWLDAKTLIRCYPLPDSIGPKYDTPWYCSFMNMVM